MEWEVDCYLFATIKAFYKESEACVRVEWGEWVV